MHVRHYCEDCGSRVFPFDSYEADTIAPAPGKRKTHILLTSSNSDPEDRQAWCWACGGWRQCVRLMEHQIAQLYISRRGVISRNSLLRRTRQVGQSARKLLSRR